MAEVVQNAEQEFWRSPLAAATAQSTAGHALVEACKQCGAEFVMGAGFCHVCGATRQARSIAVFSQSWSRYFEFHHIKERLALPTASLIAFFIGVGCVLAAIGVGLIFTATTILDWQAVQVWRIEWLLAAAAAFLAGILLRHPSSN